MHVLLLRTGSYTSMHAGGVPMHAAPASLPVHVHLQSADPQDGVSTIKFYYIHPDDVKKHRLPPWLVGCNAAGKPQTEVRLHVHPCSFARTHARRHAHTHSFDRTKRAYLHSYE